MLQYPSRPRASPATLLLQSHRSRRYTRHVVTYFNILYCSCMSSPTFNGLLIVNTCQASVLSIRIVDKSFLHFISCKRTWVFNSGSWHFCYDKMYGRNKWGKLDNKENCVTEKPEYGCVPTRLVACVFRHLDYESQMSIKALFFSLYVS